MKLILLTGARGTPEQVADILVNPDQIAAAWRADNSDKTFIQLVTGDVLYVAETLREVRRKCLS